MTPYAVPCNWEKQPNEPSYKIGLLGTPSLVRNSQFDYCRTPGLKRGQRIFGSPLLAPKYMPPQIYSRWYRRRIDATVLRVCKLFHREGCPLLYGENEFVFNLNERQLYHPQEMYTSMDDQENVFFKHRHMPCSTVLHHYISEDIIRVVPYLRAQGLAEWMFCDP